MRTVAAGRECPYERCGKERDSETNLDYFGARYFSAAQGRSTTPDWSAVPQPIPYADLSNPQTFNLYAYVGNNPLGRADADGHETQATLDPQAVKEAGETFGQARDAVAGAVKREINATLIDPYNGLTNLVSFVSGGTIQLPKATSLQLTRSEESLADVGALGLSAASPGGRRAGSRTEPTLPAKTIVSEDGVTIQHYTRSGDHGPAHLHVEDEGASTRIGQNGHPIEGDPALSSRQAGVVGQNRATIRGAVDKIMRWFSYNREQQGH